MSVQSQIPEWLQWAWALAGLAVAAGGLVWILFILWPYIRLTKRVMLESLRLSRDMAEVLARMKSEIDPLILDAKAVVVDVRAMVHEFREGSDLKRIAGTLDHLVVDGQLEKTLEAIREIPGRLERLHGGPAAPEVEVPRIE